MGIYGSMKHLKYVKDTAKRSMVFFSNCESVDFHHRLLTEVTSMVVKQDDDVDDDEPSNNKKAVA